MIKSFSSHTIATFTGLFTKTFKDESIGILFKVFI